MKRNARSRRNALNRGPIRGAWPNLHPSRRSAGRIRDWLVRLAKINSQTDLPEIFSLYSDFIKIHFPLDGTGRTARVLLNYMLIKASFPPTTTASESLYYTPEELALRYLQSF